MKNRGFTLIELLIVIGIIAVVSSITILVINPGEYFKRGRDTQRIADINNLHLALTVYYTAGVSSFDLDGPNYTGSCASPGKVFISTPSGVAGPANLPSGWTYASSTSANLRKTGGSGWMPVNLDSIPAGSPLNTLPIDPVNDLDQALYYTYTCATSSRAGYEVNANLESRQFNKGGRDDLTSKDGGDDPNVYEVGSRLTVNPMAPVGYWAMDEGTGTIAGDSSANGYNGTTAASNWTVGKIGNAANFNGSSDYINMDGPPLSKISGNKLTLTAWVKPNNLTGGKYIFSKNGPYFLRINGSNLAGDIYTGSWAAVTGTKILTTSWNYTALVYNGSIINLYVDGQFDNSVSKTGDLVTDGCHQIGRYNDGGCSSGVGNYFNGAIDEARIYNRALSAAEIQQNYNATR